MFLSNTIPHRMFADILLFELCCRNCTGNLIQRSPEIDIGYVDFMYLTKRRVPQLFCKIWRSFSFSQSEEWSVIIGVVPYFDFFSLLTHKQLNMHRNSHLQSVSRHIHESNVLQIITRFHRGEMSYPFIRSTCRNCIPECVVQLLYTRHRVIRLSERTFSTEMLHKPSGCFSLSNNVILNSAKSTVQSPL